MFVETIRAPRDEWTHWTERIRLVSDPPEALVAVVAWDSGDGHITSVHVWDAPGATADFFVERVLPVVQEEGEPANKPHRHGEPVAVYVRG